MKELVRCGLAAKQPRILKVYDGTAGLTQGHRVAQESIIFVLERLLTGKKKIWDHHFFHESES